MSRETRRVPPTWDHPKHRASTPVGNVQRYHPLRREDMWFCDDATHLMMYETCSPGTPISPACDTPESLARWLADNQANAWSGFTWTYEQWLRKIEDDLKYLAEVTNDKMHQESAKMPNEYDNEDNDLAVRLQTVEDELDALKSRPPQLYFTDEQARMLAATPAVSEEIIRRVVAEYLRSSLGGEALKKDIRSGRIFDDLRRAVREGITNEMLATMHATLVEQVGKQLDVAVERYFRAPGPQSNQPAGPGWLMLGQMTSSLVRRVIQKGLEK